MIFNQYQKEFMRRGHLGKIIMIWKRNGNTYQLAQELKFLLSGGIMLSIFNVLFFHQFFILLKKKMF